MTLQEQLQEKKEETKEHATDDRQRVMQQFLEALQDKGIDQEAIGVGDRIPSFTLPSAGGGTISSDDLLADGPLVISFYRGGWCPYCNLELSALQEAHQDIVDAGGSLVAISPELPDAERETIEKHGITFTVLSDQGNAVAEDFGLVFPVTDDLKEVYAEFGIDLAQRTDGHDKTLPMPATYVVGQSGEVVYAHVDVDYRTRAEPSEIVAAVRDASAS